ncbi:MAG: UDP-N-acetylmuramoyl-tripeptide--D-alanyl-D-alanine ligase [Coriobacteriales bacterium]|jgi:UDP-N-acetylmuramoyl-tripeptide--D-alanyl-D-alanine ligase|nr:UDP-N-acetylmuramoyl-tripeptide--D-alanyl-D-alanine ligase [Coriobacteriales bacterium]
MELPISLIDKVDGIHAVNTAHPNTNKPYIATSLAWDSREVKDGSLFIGIKGEHVDGNDFIEQAIKSGAAAVIAGRGTTAQERENANENHVALFEASYPNASRKRGANDEDNANACSSANASSDNGILALQNIASAYRTYVLNDTEVIGVTGSSGKTTTKDMTAAVLGSKLSVMATSGNYNNHIGAPATVLSADKATRALVVEMGMSSRGEIATLAHIARPRIGVITNIGTAHMQQLGSRENIALAKAELLEALPNGTGIAVLNGDDPYSHFMRKAARLDERDIKLVYYGLNERNDVHAADIEYDDNGRASFNMWLKGDEAPTRVKLALSGKHNISNALAAAAVGQLMGVAAYDIANALANVNAGKMRQHVFDTQEGVTIIDDTYNANPDSMRAALDVLAHFPAGRQHIAVLGDMLELGESSRKLHKGIGLHAADTNVDALITIGEQARMIANGAREGGMRDEHIYEAQDVAGALDVLRPFLSADKPVILVKASRGMHLEDVVGQVA